MYVLVVIFVILAAASAAVRTQQVVSGLGRPVAMIEDPFASTGGTRKFIVLQTGKVLILKGGTLNPTPFLDLSGVVSSSGEQGLLGLAFHPSYASNGYFFVNYTKQNASGVIFTVIRRLKVSTNPDTATVGNEASETVLSFQQPYANHNGGQLLFGPKDGQLYIFTGDGGSAGDPGNRAQSLQSLFGKVLRVTVNVNNAAQAGYSIPAGNPYYGDTTKRQEILHFGLRNPWRNSFDVNGNLFIADVGQQRLEEVSLALAGEKGLNFGWRRLEGIFCYNPTTSCRQTSQGALIPNLRDPFIVYSHTGGACSVTGGYRYRGSALSGLSGKYIYGDYCNGNIYAATQRQSGTSWGLEVLIASTGFLISSFGEDFAGELYVLDIGNGGAIHKLVSV